MQHFQIHRKKTKQIKVGSVLIGGNAPIAVQTMTNTLTSDIDATVEQILRVQKAGADIVRVSCPDEKSTKALKKIIRQVCIPIIADIHFHYKRALEAADNGAACLRINPGNIGSIDRVREIVAAARANNLSIRIGVNAGSLEKYLLKKYKEPCVDAMVDSALFHANILEKCNFYDFKISVKASNIFLAIESYRKLSTLCEYPLHIGITEAGGMCSGTVKSALGIGLLLQEGIGDTIRVSLSADPVKEINVGFNILKALHLRHRGVNIISCPSCARQQFDVINIVDALERATSHITEPITVSLIGCVVNGPGEARQSDIGLTGGGNNTHQIYIEGSKFCRIQSQDIVQHMVRLIEERIVRKKENCDVLINS